jgi:hypothetical protein
VWHPERLAAVGKSAAGPIRKQDDWIHRRVESIEFADPDDAVYWRRLSVDFTIPDLEPIARDPDGQPVHRYYVPVSFIAKWPPLRRFDLRSGSGDPLPFLTSRQNALLDAAALQELALTTADASALSNEETAQIVTIAKSPPSVALTKFHELFPEGSPDSLNPPWQILARDPVFMHYTRTMCAYTILWLRVDGEPGERTIVKFSYDTAWNPNVARPWQPEYFSIKPLVFDFQTPHIGSVGSYHLSISLPAPLVARKSQMILYEPQQDEEASGFPADSQIRYFCSSAGTPVRTRTTELYTEVATRHAKFYAWGQRPGLNGRVFVETTPDINHFLFAASLASTALAAILGLFALRFSDVLSDRAAGASVLLIAPAVFAYFLSRQSEHFLANRFLRGVRWLIIVASGWPLLAAGVIAAAGSNPTPAWVKTSFIVLASCSAASAVLLCGLWAVRIGVLAVLSLRDRRDQA